MKKQSDLSKLMNYAGSKKCLIFVSWILSAVSALMTLVPFYYIWKIIREVLWEAPDFKNAAHITQYGWTAVGFALGAMVIYVAALMCSHIAAFHVQANIRSKLMRHILTLPMGTLEKEGTGKIRRIVADSSAATENYLAHQLPDMAGAYVTPFGLLALLMVFDWRLGLLSLIPMVLSFCLMGAFMSSGMEMMKEYENALADMSNEAVEYIRGVPVVKTFGQSVFSFKRFKDSIDRYSKWIIAYSNELRMPMVIYTVAINTGFVILIIAAALFNGSGFNGEFFLNLLFYIIITPTIVVTLNKIMFSTRNQMVVADALARIDGILEMKSLKTADIAKKPKDSSIDISNVSFAYEGSDKNAIDDITIHIKQGEQVAFVGPSGGGKSTLAKLVARFFDVSSGSISVGGVDVKDMNEDELMDMVSFVFQDSKLLKMSIFENVRMGKPDATKEEVMETIKNAGCMDIVEKFKDGIDTVIGTKGVYVSGGEAQRIAIARAMLKDAPILILDEATAFADPDNEVKVREAFEKLSVNKTVIMIAHRLSTVTDVNRVFVLKDGKIAEQGNHENLLQKDGVYAHMWKEYNKAVNWKVGA